MIYQNILIDRDSSQKSKTNIKKKQMNRFLKDSIYKILSNLYVFYILNLLLPLVMTYFSQNKFELVVMMTFNCKNLKKYHTKWIKF